MTASPFAYEPVVAPLLAEIASGAAAADQNRALPPELIEKIKENNSLYYS